MALYTHCLVARKEAALQKMQIEGFTEKEYGMVRLESVGDVLFQALMLDNIRLPLMTHVAGFSENSMTFIMVVEYMQNIYLFI